MVVLEEFADKCANGKAEAAVKVSGKDDELTGLWFRYDLLAGDSAFDPRWDPPRVAEVIDVRLGNF